MVLGRRGKNERTEPSTFVDSCEERGVPPSGSSKKRKKSLAARIDLPAALGYATFLNVYLCVEEGED